MTGLVLLVLVACGPPVDGDTAAPSPGEPGHVHCSKVPLVDACELGQVASCCEVLDERGTRQCWYETQTGGEWLCSQTGCGLAEAAMLEDLCGA